MIEIKNLKKIYAPKNQPQVNALDGISLTLGNGGLTFILGTSGSGKSTLLNMLGGLDNYTDGEIIVDGFSTKNFSETDFDKYRNNQIGFVFQDFNLLSGFTVEKNLSLALEMQGLPANDEAIAEALCQVDLKGYEKRKVTELSGGQRQRVAVARAIIKNPTILLADEPTGNLDSETGDELFELLKRISKNTLVVVVSHDRDSAEKFADRIIEIEDGRIVADSKPLSSDMAKIYTSDDKPQKKLQKLSGKSIFALILQNLRTRKVRLAVMVMLFVFSLTFIGLGVGTLRFDKRDFTGQEYTKSSVTDGSFTLLKKATAAELLPDKKNMNDEEAAAIINSLGKNILSKKLFILPDASTSCYITKSDSIFSYDCPDYYSYAVSINSGFVSFTNEELAAWGLSKVSGRLPKDTYEIAISMYVFEYFKYMYASISSAEDILGFTLQINGNEFTIVGVIDTAMSGNYDILKTNPPTIPSTSEYAERENLLMDLIYKIINSLHTAVFVSPKIYNLDKFVNLSYASKNNLGTGAIYNAKAEAYNEQKLADKTTYIVDENSLDDGEILLPKRILSVLLNNDRINDSSLFSDEDVCALIYKNKLEANVYLSATTPASYNLDDALRLKVVGICNSDLPVVNQTTFDKFVNKNLTTAVASKFDGSKQSFLTAYDMTANEKLLESYDVVWQSTLSSDINAVITLAETVHGYAFYASLGFGVFAATLMLNFFFVSIADKRKENGTLRAIGARGKDLMYIYLIETVFISLLSFALASAVFTGTAYFLEQYLSSTRTIYINADIFNMSFITYLWVFMFSLIIGIIGSIVPSLKISKKKPIELIKNT